MTEKDCEKIIEIVDSVLYEQNYLGEEQFRRISNAIASKVEDYYYEGNQDGQD